jgi:hypothetical protein
VDFTLQNPGEKSPLCAIKVKAKDQILERDYSGQSALGEEFKKVR